MRCKIYIIKLNIYAQPEKIIVSHAHLMQYTDLTKILYEIDTAKLGFFTFSTIYYYLTLLKLVEFIKKFSLMNYSKRANPYKNAKLLYVLKAYIPYRYIFRFVYVLLGYGFDLL